MIKGKLTLFCAVLLGLCVITAGNDFWTPPAKKIIDLSWGSPTVDFLAANLAKMDQVAPIDGVAVKFMGTRTDSAGKKHAVNFTTSVMGKTALKREYFEKQIKLYKSLKFNKFIDNFFYTTVMPGNQDWFNDQDWAALCSNFALAAAIAKECGMKGILFDPEEYAGKFWSYNTTKRPRKEVSAVARKRGQQWGRAIFNTFPDIKLFALYWLPAKNSFMTDFINGVYDVLPPTAQIIDGCETAGYHSNSRWDFQVAKDLSRKSALEGLHPENVAKYKAQTTFAPACYVDAILGVNKKWAKHLYPEITESTPVHFLTQVVHRALEASDEYVWLYSEQGCWWSGGKYPVWDAKVPGTVNALAGVKEPIKLNVADCKNVIQNGTFDKEGGWEIWQHRISPRGKGKWHDGLLDMCETNWGAIRQTVKVLPKEMYLFRAKIRYNKAYRGKAILAVNYFDATGASVNSGRFDKELVFDRTKNYQNWNSQAFLTEVPEGAVTMKVQLHIRQQGRGEFFSIDDFDCRRLQK